MIKIEDKKIIFTCDRCKKTNKAVNKNYIFEFDLNGWLEEKDVFGYKHICPNCKEMHWALK